MKVVQKVRGPARKVRVNRTIIGKRFGTERSRPNTRRWYNMLAGAFMSYNIVCLKISISNTNCEGYQNKQDGFRRKECIKKKERKCIKIFQ